MIMTNTQNTPLLSDRCTMPLAAWSLNCEPVSSIRRMEPVPARKRVADANTASAASCAVALCAMVRQPLNAACTLA